MLSDRKAGRKESIMREFEKAMANALIGVYMEAYGENAWNSKSEEEKQETLHELLGSFLTVAKNR